MVGRRGRKSQWTYIDGELVMVKKPSMAGDRMSVHLPKEWVDIQELQGKILYLLLDCKDNQIIIKPCFNEVEAGVL